MAPVDNTPLHCMGNFELIYSLQAYNRVPVHEFKSTKTGLTVVIAEVEGPVVNGFFTLVTEAFDDDGLPHTLEHLIFLGSEKYPYKGVLDLLANRCLASGTNAWTDVDHTCYTMETAGSEGFLSLMPIFLEHILYPTLSNEGFITEVHHIAGTGEDAGVVYCEMQGRENSGESRIHLGMARAIYPGRCGYSSETGGIMKNLRETTTNKKVRDYHKEFYRPENLKIVITGQVKRDEVFKALESLEEKILSKGERPPFTRPWEAPVPPLPSSLDLKIKYPSDEESNGIVSVAWRGASAVTELYTMTATVVLMKYLTDFSVSPLQQAFVEIPDPYASKVAYNLMENSETVLYLLFESVPYDKLTLVKPKLDELLKNIVANDDFDMARIKSIINRHKLESLSNLENDPHHTVAFMIIGHMLYGHTKEDLEQRINPLADLDKLEQEPKSYWLSLLDKFLVSNKVVSIEGIPSIEEQQAMAAEEKQRVEKQIADLGEHGLATKEKELEDAIAFNEKPAPEEMLLSIPIPKSDSINFHEITRFCSDSEDEASKKRIDLTNTPVFTYFDHVKTGFVYMSCLMNTSNVPMELRTYIPLLMETILESPVRRDGVLVSYEQVVTELQDDTVSVTTLIGLGSSGSSRFSCGSYSHTVSLMLQVEEKKFEKGIDWLRELLHQTELTAERLKIIATKMVNDVSYVKRQGNKVCAYLMKGMRYVKESNVYHNSLLRQQKFLTGIIESLESERCAAVIETFEKLRRIITEPSGMVLYFAANLDRFKDNERAVKALGNVLPSNVIGVQKSLQVTPDYKMIALHSDEVSSGCVVGMGCLESSFFYQTTPSINDHNHSDIPALLLYLQYIIQPEGPMWKQVRGKGLAYGYTMLLKPNEGLLYLIFSKATNVVGAYKEAEEIVTKQLTESVWDNTLLDSARSSLIFEIIESEKTIGSVIEQSLLSYFQGVDYKYNRTLVCLVDKVTPEDLNRVGKKYVAPLFDPKQVKTAIVCDPTKAEEISSGFKEFSLELRVYPTLEESFLNN